MSMDHSLFELNPLGNPRAERVNPRSLTAQIPSENFNGTMLGQSLRLTRFIRNEAHGDVYAAEDLFSSNKYEVKAYTLRGISPNGNTVFEI